MERLIPTNVGLLDSRDHFNRFSMHVGSDVYEALSTADRQGKSQTHIAASGFRNGEKTTISAALSGRFWSMQTAPNLKAWTDWCDEQGVKLTDASIDLASEFDVLIDDDRAREAPDLVGMKINGDELVVTLGHCKYSSEPTPDPRRPGG
ncbi:hypothetical protein ACH4E5_02600 [Streptomyces afghaniensis]|uniref:hypothetical protein n=1 Tax=Streptomyces afghaniensis TaxID=66865 RepID=UPI00378B3B14